MRYFLLPLILSLMTSCGPIKKGASAAADTLIDCAKHDISKAITEDGPTLVAATMEIVQSGGDQWRDILGKLGKAAGDDALACAVESARAGLAAGRHFATSAGAARATAYIAERAWHFKQ